MPSGRGAAGPPSDMHEGAAYQGSAHVFYGRRWAVVMAAEEVRRRAARGLATPGSEAGLDVEAVLAHLPLGHPLLDEYTPF